MRVIVTRPAIQAHQWVERLRLAGLDAIALPLLGIEPLADPSALHAAWHRLARYRLVVFVSPNAVLQFFDARPAGAPWPVSTLAGSPGPGTSRTLHEAGIDPASVAEPGDDAASFDAEALWATLRERDWRGSRVLIVRGETGRDGLVTVLVSAGAEVEVIAAYRRGSPALELDAAPRLQLALTEPALHLWFFSSSAAIERLVELAGPFDFGAASALATHPQIAASARGRGFGRVIEARPAPEAVIACLQSLRK